MIHKIQKYLLVHFPLCWNMKIVPFLTGAFLLNLLLFAIGFSSAGIDFTKRYSYDHMINEGLGYFSIAIICLLILIVWLVFYAKNNAFKVFYPQKKVKLYTEWVLIFVCMLSLALAPLSFRLGIQEKVKSYASKEDTAKAIEILEMIDYLLPDEKNSYFKEYPVIKTNQPTEYLKGEAIVEQTSSNYYDSKELDSILASPVKKYDESQFPNFAQLSLLNKDTSSYHSYGYWDIDISQYLGHKPHTASTVYNWLVNENKIEISNLIDNFLALSQKHKLKTNLDKETWMQLVYNPKKYPVGDFNLICRDYDEDNFSAQGVYSYSKEITYRYYVQYYELKNAYERIGSMHFENDYLRGLTLFMVCFAGILSLMIFSFRCTSGRDWLIAFVSGGVLIFINFMLMFFISEISNWDSDNSFIFFLLFWIILFIGQLIYLINRIQFRKSKGISGIFINHIFILLPLIPAFGVLIFMFIHENYHYNTLDEYGARIYKSCETCSFIEQHAEWFILANIILSFITIFLYTILVVKRWKALPEQ